MDLSNEVAFEDQIITNASFIGGGASSAWQGYGHYSSKMYRPHAQEPQTTLPQAPGPVATKPQIHEPQVVRPSPSRETLTTKPVPNAHSIVNFVRSLFSINADDIASERFLKLTAIIVNVLKNLNEIEIDGLKKGLSGHIGLYEDRFPWIDLEAAYLLNLNYDLLWKFEVPRPIPKSVTICPKMRAALEDGQYIPMQHILHCLAIFNFHPEIERYPCKITELVPQEFVAKIKRSDVIRGANIHCLLMGLKFPLVAVQFPCLIDELWHFMLAKKFSAMAGIELYNGVFFDFSRQLGQGIVPSIDHFPSHIMEKAGTKRSKS